jgi:hypothetical protein
MDGCDTLIALSFGKLAPRMKLDEFLHGNISEPTCMHASYTVVSVTNLLRDTRTITFRATSPMNGGDTVIALSIRKFTFGVKGL